MSVVASNLQKVYTGGDVATPALRGVSFKIDPGQFVCIMGPSGSGKSTLLNLIGALDRPTSGKIYVEGYDISTMDDDQLAHLRSREIGFVFQTFNLIHRLTALENVEVPLLTRNLRSKEVRAKALNALKAVGLGHRVRHTPNRLSGGEQQRVAIARTLVTSPHILLGDEPTGNLDTKTAISVLDLMKELNRRLGVTLILVTHSHEVAREADRIIHVRDGVVEGIIDNRTKTDQA